MTAQEGDRGTATPPGMPHAPPHRAAGATHCYTHPQVPAVGLCSVCHRGVCKECQVVFEGRRFCKRDAESRLEREDRMARSQKRGIEISLASVIAFLDGVSGVVVGFLLAVIGVLGASARSSPLVATTVAPFLDFFSAALQFPSSNAVSTGMISVILGSVDTIAGYYLWQRSKAAAILAVIATLLGGGVIATYLVVLALAGPFVFVWAITAVLEVCLVAYGWRHLG